MATLERKNLAVAFYYLYEHPKEGRANILRGLWLCSASVNFSSSEGTCMQKLASAVAGPLVFSKLQTNSFCGSAIPKGQL